MELECTDFLTLMAAISAGVSQTGLLPSYGQFTVDNSGTAPLVLVGLSIEGPDAALFATASNCPGLNASVPELSLMPGDACAIAVQFDPVVTGAFNATLKLASNDPDKSLVFIDVTGMGDLDVDGIHFSEEQAAPNGGDGNNDLVPDNIQNNIASFAAYSSGQYVTIIAPPGYLLEGVSGSSLSTASAETPQGVTFYNGLLEYSITIPLATSDNTIQMGVLLPSGDASTVYYNYGITADDPSPHLYDFSYDGLTGANYLGVVSIASPSGGSIQRKMYILNYVDGERGDDDLVVNGSVQAIGAVGELSSSGSGGSGAFSWYVILVGFVAIFVGRCRTIYFYKRVMAELISPDGWYPG